MTAEAEDWRIPLCRPRFGPDEIAAAAAVLRGGWLAAGEVTRAFEVEFAARCGVRHAIALSSGTAALHLAHVALGVGPGDRVLCPALTFVATANAARYTGAEVVFADVVDATDLTVSPADLARKISPRTRAVTVMHYGGFACRMPEVLALARERGVALIEDCAHAPLARAADLAGARRPVGGLGAVGCFSFYGNKNLATGEGGMLTTDDDAVAERVRRLRSHDMSLDSWQRYRGRLTGYEVPGLGYNYRFDDVRAAIGRVQLARLDETNRRRREVFSWYVERLSSSAHVGLPFARRDLEDAAPHILSVVLERPDEAAARCAARGIQTSRHYDLVNGFAAYGADTSGTPRAAALGLLTLPFGPELTRDEVARVADAVLGTRP